MRLAIRQKVDMILLLEPLAVNRRPGYCHYHRTNRIREVNCASLSNFRHWSPNTLGERRKTAMEKVVKEKAEKNSEAVIENDSEAAIENVAVIDCFFFRVAARTIVLGL